MQEPSTLFRGSRLPNPSWFEWRRYKTPLSDCPMLDAAIWIHRKTGDARFVVTSDLGLFWVCPCTHPVRWGITHEEEEVLVAKFVRKAVDAQRRNSAEKSAEGVRWEESHPAVWEYLSLDTHEDGAPRTTSMLCVFVEQGCVKIALQDRERGESLWVSAPTFVEALHALEGRLASGEGEWRQSKYKGTAGGNKRR